MDVLPASPLAAGEEAPATKQPEEVPPVAPAAPGRLGAGWHEEAEAPSSEAKPSPVAAASLEYWPEEPLAPAVLAAEVLHPRAWAAEVF